MEFILAKTTALAAATSTVRLPQLSSTTPASLVVKASRPTPPAPADKRSRHQAERSRYHAQCRMAMAF